MRCNEQNGLSVGRDSIEEKWSQTDKKRLLELCSGTTKGIPGEEVFDEIGKRHAIRN